SSPRLLLFLSLAATAPPYPLSLHDALPISQILVHVVGADASMLARIIDVLKQLLPRQLHAAAHEPGQAAVLQGDVVLHAALAPRSEEHTSELQSRENLVCRLLLEKKKAPRH